MLSFRQYIQEVFSGGDRGFPYEKVESPSFATSEYKVSLPDHVDPAHVHIQHEHNGHNADVSFTMPKFGYNIKPEEKETYDAAVKSHKGEPDEEFHSGYGISAVRDKHGTEAMERVAKASGSFQTFRGNGGEAKHHTFGMFATVKKIIHEHGKSNPHIRAFTFSSSTSSPSRLKLYSKIAQRHGGEGSGGQYEIPNPHYKYKPLSDDAQSLLAHAGFWQGE